MDAVLFVVHGTQILFKYDPHNLSKDSHLLLPILVSQQVLAFEEEEEISEIKLNDGRVMSLKFYQHHGGQYQVVMTGVLSEIEALGAKAYKLINLLCGPAGWNGTLNETLTQCLDTLMQLPQSLQLGFSGPTLTVSNFPTLALPPMSWIIAVKGSSVSYPMHGPSELPNELDISFMVLLSQTLLPHVLFLKGNARQCKPKCIYNVYTFRTIPLPEHSLDLILLRKIENPATTILNKLVTIRQVLKEEEILRRRGAPAILQLCQLETFKLSFQDLGRQMQSLATAAVVNQPTTTTVHLHHHLNRVIFSIDTRLLLVKMQFLQHDSPKSTLRKIGRDCSAAFLKVNVETVSCQCLRRLTIPLKCHANAKAWVLVNDQTKIMWARKDHEAEDEKYSSALLEAISNKSSSQQFPLVSNDKLVYKYKITDSGNYLTLYVLVISN